MTTYSTISNASVAVGGIPSSTTVTALRDNPIAMAEAASGAPINVMGWHPVDKVTVGDGKDGLIYSFAVNGTVSSVVTPNFEDGYEYRIVAADLNHSGGATTRGYVLDLYWQTSAAYSVALNVGDPTGSQEVSFDAEILLPRLSLESHRVRCVCSLNGALITPYGGVADSPSGTAQKVLRARIYNNTYSITKGQIWLFRRREYASSP